MLEFQFRVKPLTKEDRVHMPAIRKVLKKKEFEPEVKKALRHGEIVFSLENGFSGKGYDKLHEAVRWVLDNNLVEDYQKAYTSYKERLSAHEELDNYGKVGKGALVGIGAGVAAGAAIDGITTHLDYHGVWAEIGARSTPALLEAYGIAQPFFSRARAYYKWKYNGIGEKPPPFTSTELWALTQLLGPIVGFGMLVLGEATGLNQSPAYKATAVFTVNTGNNVIGSGSCFYQEFKDVREARKNRPREQKFWKRVKNFFDDLYLAGCNFWMDKFQSSNVLVAGGWYGAELGLRSAGIAAENASFNGGFGGGTLAAVESGALSCDTAAAAGLAILREKGELRKGLEELG